MSKRLALIIGNSLYRDKALSKLITPDADVGALADALLDSELGGFDDVKQLVNNASNIVRREIFNLFANKTREDMLLFYFSGHGVLDDQGKLYLALKDTDTKALRGTAIPAGYITNEMDNSRSKRQVVILDCCHSGAFARGSKGTPGASVGTAGAFEGSGYGRVVLTASDSTQYAWEGDQVIGEAETSLFTHFLVQGIQSGEADANGDGQITVDELYDFVYSRVLDKTSKQTPGKWSYKEQGELVIAHSQIVETLIESSQEVPVIRKEQEQQLDQLYTKGLSAYWLEDWDSVCEYFEAILEISPAYQDVREKLEVAREQKNREDLYNQALSNHEEGNFSSAIASLELLISQAPNFKDASEKLDQIKEEKKISDLSTQAKKFFDSGMYDAVIRVVESISRQYPKYDDPEGLLDKAKKEIKEQQRIQMLDKLYKEAVLNLNAGKLKVAKDRILEIQNLEKGYKDTDKLFDKVNHLIKVETAGIKKKEKERKRSEERAQRAIKAKEAPGYQKPQAAAEIAEEQIKKKKTAVKKRRDSKALTNIPRWIWGVVWVVLLIGIIIAGIQLSRKDESNQSPVVEAFNPFDGIVYSYIPAGDFQMGVMDIANASPPHNVYLDAFWIGQTEVTNANYWLCVEEGKCKAPEDPMFNSVAGKDLPVFVTWDDAQNYCAWVGGRLPTEAEWEKAARGGLEGKRFPWGNNSPSCTEGAFNGARYDICGDGPVPIFSYAPNEYGLWDVAGNAWEWVGDWYSVDYYTNSPTDNPTGPDLGMCRVVRGGSFLEDVDRLSVFWRECGAPNLIGRHVGFRCILFRKP